MGTKWGPKDGTSLFERALSAIANSSDLGQGRVIVTSAGNEGYDPDDPHKDPKDKWHAGNNGPGSRTIVVNSANYEPYLDEIVWVNIWYPGDESYEITLTGPNGGVYGP